MAVGEVTHALVVEDDWGTSDMYVRELRELGLEVSYADTFENAMELMQTLPRDGKTVVFLDHVLKRKAIGQDIAEAILKMAKKTPIVSISKDKQNYADAQIQKGIDKVNRESLSMAIRGALAKARARV